MSDTACIVLHPKRLSVYFRSQSTTPDLLVRPRLMAYLVEQNLHLRLAVAHLTQLWTAA